VDSGLFFFDPLNITHANLGVGATVRYDNGGVISVVVAGRCQGPTRQIGREATEKDGRDLEAEEVLARMPPQEALPGPFLTSPLGEGGVEARSEESGGQKGCRIEHTPT